VHRTEKNSQEKRYTVAVSTRREFILAATALPVAAQHEHPDTAAPVAYTTRVFSAEEMKQVAKLVDLIIPRTDTPGASDAHVPEFIDRKLSLDDVLREKFLAGLRSFDGVLKEHDPFSKLLKDLTIDGYYTSKEGLTQELGWHGNTFLTDFEGCTHPEHQS
jgi:Gluconate 2-dehydrogenase subunit 3